MTGLAATTLVPRAFRHEALLYRDDVEFTNQTAAFVREGLAAGERILALLGRTKIDLLRSALGNDAGSVLFADMGDVGRNPARIIPAWQTFVVEHAARFGGLRGIGEGIYPERSEAELRECHLHESLLNIAFEDTPGFWLLCPYDIRTLPKAVVETAHRTHPVVGGENGSHPSADYRPLNGELFFDDPLPEPVIEPTEFAFDEVRLHELRLTVLHHALASELSADRAEDLSLALSELATNSLRYGGGEGTLRYWQDGDVLIYEIQDSGFLNQPMVGRRRPNPSQQGGFGLWIVNQLCDLVQVGSSPFGTVVRVHMQRN